LDLSHFYNFSHIFFFLTLMTMRTTRRCWAIPLLLITVWAGRDPPQHCQAAAFQPTQHFTASRQRPSAAQYGGKRLRQQQQQQQHVAVWWGASNVLIQQNDNGDETESSAFLLTERNSKRHIPRSVFQWIFQSRRKVDSTSSTTTALESSAPLLPRQPQQPQHPLSTIRKKKSRLRSFRKAVRAFTVSLFLAMILRVGSCEAAAAAVTGGRMGGSFKPSTSRSYSPSSSSSSSSSWGSGRSSSLGYRPLLAPPMVHHYSSPQIVFYPRTTFYGAQAISTTTYSPTAANILIVTGTGALLAFGAYQHLSQNNFYSGYISDEKSVLGPGATTASMTVCLDVPNRNSPDSILYRLERLSEKVDTSRREGVQDLISNGM
jgi:hypothetical protein